LRASLICISDLSLLRSDPHLLQDEACLLCLVFTEASHQAPERARQRAMAAASITLDTRRVQLKFACLATPVEEHQRPVRLVDPATVPHALDEPASSGCSFRLHFIEHRAGAHKSIPVAGPLDDDVVGHNIDQDADL
jgi:hypothetical protein